MPYDGKNFETKPDLSLASLLRFCESKPADEGYCYTDTGECLIAQYFRSINFPFIRLSAGRYRDIDHNLKPLPDEFERIALTSPRTFGGAASRIRTLLASRAA